MKTFKTIFVVLVFLGFVTPFVSTAQVDLSLKNEESVQLYPNPVVSGQAFSIQIQAKYQQQLTYYIYDFSGKLIEESQTITVGFGEQYTTLSSHISEKGMYFIKTIIEDKNKSTKTSKVKKFYVI